MSGRRQRDRFLPWIQLAVDVLAAYGTLYGVYWARFQSTWFSEDPYGPDFQQYNKLFYFSLIIFVFFLRNYGLYRPARSFTFLEEAGKVIKAVGAGILVLLAITFFIRGFSFSRTFLVSAGITLLIMLPAARMALGVLVMLVDRYRGSFRNILVLGCDSSAFKLMNYYKRNPRFSMRVAAFLDDEREIGGRAHGVPVEGRLKDLRRYLGAHRDIHEVVLASSVSNDQVLKIIYECEKELVTFRWIADIFGLITSRMMVSHRGGISLLSFTDSPLLDWENRLLKRLMDILLSLLALIALSPVLILIALVVKLGSRGPVFYKQKRVGEDGRHFNIYKFRTMRVDAEKETGPIWARENDPRRTFVGTFLRENNLDELPQLLNVLRGNMSLVGPRPERPHFVSQFKEDVPRYMARHSIRSGITGWAQVNGLRGNTSIEERTKYDLYYIENWSLGLDIKIIFMTALKIFSSRNAY